TEHHPGDREQSIGRAVQRRHDGELYWHSIDGEGNDQRGRQRRERRHPRRLSPDAEHQKQHHDRNRGDQSGKGEVAANRLVVVLPHGASYTPKRPGPSCFALSGPWLGAAKVEGLRAKAYFLTPTSFIDSSLLRSSAATIDFSSFNFTSRLLALTT